MSRPISTLIISFGAGLDTIHRRGKDVQRAGLVSRLRAAAASVLYRRHPGSVVLFSGGCLHPDWKSEAQAMKEYVVHDKTFHISADDILTEEQSIDTADNVRCTVRMMRRLGLQPERVILATSGLHLRRAVRYFMAHGVHVTPMAADEVLRTIPEAQGMLSQIIPHTWSIICREYLLHVLQLVDRGGRIPTLIAARSRGC